MMVKLVFMLFLAMLSAGVRAEANEDTCRDWAGVWINSKECNDYRKEHPRLSDVDCYQSPQCRAETEARAAERRRKAEELRAQQDAHIAEIERSEQQQHADAAAKRKAACGADYLNPKVGMALSRAQQCVGTFHLGSTVHVADSTSEMYIGRHQYLQVANGKIVAWGDLVAPR